MYQSISNDNINTNNSTLYEKFLTRLGNFFGFIGTYFCCCCGYPYTTVEEGYNGTILEFGRLKKVTGSGLYYVNPLTTELKKVDVRLQVVDLDRQVVMSKDNVTLSIDGVVCYKICDIKKSIFGITDIKNAVIQLTYTTLRDVIGKRTLQEILECREELAKDIFKIVDEKSKEWGVDISSIRLKDINMSNELQQTLSSAAQAKRHAESKLISAQADVESAKLMKQSSDILNSEAAMQIRYLETINSIAKSNNAKVIFLPSDYKQVGKNRLVNNVTSVELQ